MAHRANGTRRRRALTCVDNENCSTIAQCPHVFRSFSRPSASAPPGLRRRSVRAGRRSPSAPRGSSSAGSCSCSWRASCACACPGSTPRLVGMACAVAVYQLSFFAAIRLTGVAVGTVVAIGTGPAAAGVLGRLVNGERLTARWAQATALAALGVLLLAGDGGASVDPTGVALAVTSGVGYATYTVLSKRMLEAGEAPEGVMAAGFGGAGLLLLPALLVAGPGFLATPGGLAMAVYLAAVPDRARLRALLARAAPSVERRDGDDRPGRAAHRGAARGHRARRAAIGRGRCRRGARPRRPARPRGARRRRLAPAGAPA